MRTALLIALLIVHATWSAPAAGQVADLLHEILATPGPHMGCPDPASALLERPEHVRSARRSLSYEYERREPFTSSSTDGQALWSRRSDVVRYAHPVRSGGWRFGVAAAMRNDRLDGWIRDDPTNPNLHGDAAGGELDVWATDDAEFYGRVYGPLGGGRDTSPRRPWGWALLWTPSTHGGIVCERRGATLQSRFQAPVGDDDVDFRLNQDLALLRIEGRHELVPGLHLSLARYRGEGSPDRPLTTAFRDELQLNGEFDGVTATATALVHPRLELGVQRADWTMEHEGGLYWGGQRYGRLNVLRGHGDDSSAAIRWRPAGPWALKMNIAARNMNASGRGRVESWPFTETAVDLLGLRRVAEGELDLRIASLAFAVERRSATARLTAGYARHTVDLTGFLESWIPGPLGIGRSHYVSRDLEVDEIRIDEVSLQWARAFGRLKLSLNLRQIVGVSVQSSGGDGNSTPGSPAAPPSSLPGWWGGLTMRTAIHILI